MNPAAAHSAIADTIAHLRRLTQVTMQPAWHYCPEDRDNALDPATWSDWAIATPNAKDHLAWPQGQQVRWFGRILRVPSDLAGYPLQGLQLRIALTWWATSAEIFVDGQPVQSGDLFDCATRLLLRDAVMPGDEVAIALRLVSPGHDEGALVQSVCLYESWDGPPEPSFVADELAVIHTYCQAFVPEKLETVAIACAKIDWDHVQTRDCFDTMLAQLRSDLLPLSDLIKQRTIHLTGHAHLDMAWLWPVDETWEAAERTFASVLQLQQEFPELIFCHSTPALYEWLEQHRPQMFEQICRQVRAGNWEAIGGLWIEPEMNLISGESIVRHILYGQRYYQQKFGHISRIAWLPDTFGFNWQLPQLLKQGGMDYFVTQKLRWNDTTTFPHALHQWRSPDGTSVVSLMSAPIGTGIDPVKMAEFACEWETATGLTEALWLPGVGDHGGGPTRDMLNVARRWQTSPFFPQLKFTPVIDYLNAVAPVEIASAPISSSAIAAPLPALPVWNDELYLEFHRGCYTTHADQKQFNRTCEARLQAAELWATLAVIATAQPYPKTELETAWKQVLFNQFHDILPGTAIPAVFADANPAWIAAQQTSEAIIQRSLHAIAQQLTWPAAPHPDARAIVVFNSLGWAVDWPMDPETESVEMIPAHGYRCLWITEDAGRLPSDSAPTLLPPELLERDRWVLENQFLRLTVDPLTGDLSSLFDRSQQRQVLAGPGNQLQAFQDSGQYWDAWNIDPHYADHPLPAPQLQHIEYSDRPPHLGIAVTRRIGQSDVQQIYRLRGDLVEIATLVPDWSERHILVKAAFPLNLEAAVASYEIPCGVIQRPVQCDRDSPDRSGRDRHTAQWEVPALGWADLSTPEYGVSVFSDYKHGYDAQAHQLRLTLLRGAEWPDPDADRGVHTFTYGLYPHRGNWQAAQTTRRVQTQLRSPQILHRPAAPDPTGGLPTDLSFFSLGADNLMLMSFKPAETDGNGYILRCYECQGQPAELRFTNALGLTVGDRLDLLERPIHHPQPTHIAPWQIATFQIFL